jgi:Uma2 family endonuclease
VSDPTVEREYPLRWSVEEYFGLVHRGVLQPDDRVELLDGLIVAMSPQNPPHAAATSRVSRTLQLALGERAMVRVQMPIVLRRSVPEPDVAVVANEPRDYADAHPRTALLVVEVADSSLPQDRLTKASLYARAEIGEYWVVNLVADRVEIYRDPTRGTYSNVSAARPGERIELRAFSDTTIAVDDLLPPRR